MLGEGLMPDDPRFEVENPEIAQVMRDLGRKLKQTMPAGWGFTLLMFDFHEGPGKGSLFYISSARREDMVKSMREFLAKEAGN